MKIVFFYPSHTVGGAEYLIIRLVRYMRRFHQCYVVDYRDGIFRKLDHTLGFNEMIDFEDGFRIPPESTIVTFPSMIVVLKLKIDNRCNNTILLWAVQADNFEGLIFLKNKLPEAFVSAVYHSKISQTISYLIDKEALIVMDGGIIQRYKYLYNFTADLESQLCPIPIESSTLIKEYNVNSGNQVKFAWLGRLSREKIYALLKVLDDINSLDVETVFDVIGDGDCESIVKSFKPRKGLEIRFLGTIVTNLDEILLEHDVVFAMGTSALEAAKLGIPSVLMDASYYEFPKDYRYRWLFESEEYVLGYMLPSEKIRKSKLVMADIVNTCCDSSKYRSVATQCYSYAMTNHSIQSVYGLLSKFIANTKLHISDIDKLPIFRGANRSFYIALNNIKKNALRIRSRI